MKPEPAAARRHSLSVMKLPLLCFSLLLAAPLSAGQREVLSGNFASVVDEEYDLLFSFGPDREPYMALVSELDYPGVLQTWSRARVEVERDVAVTVSGAVNRIPVWPRETSRGTALRMLPSELLWPPGEPLSPERWAGANTGLHPTLHENQPFEVSGPADYDGDGIIDERDRFPSDPAESNDNDDDGTGDNADPDDDNDRMSDAYELAHRLDWFTDDSLLDADGDGFTNLDESAADTAAQDGASYFHIETVDRTQPDKITLTWQARPGRRYEVWHRPHLDPRGARLAENLTVREPERLSVTLDDRGQGDFYFLRVISDPF